MNPLLWLGAGGLVAYLFLRTREGASAASAPTTASAAEPQASVAAPTPSSPSIVAGHAAPTGPTKSPPQQITASPPSRAEVVSNPQATVIRLGGRWCWPVPRYQGRAPVISDGFGSHRPSFPGGQHKGVDLMFARIASDKFPIGPNGTKGFVMPDAWLAVAAADGVLWSVGYTQHGGAVVLDHGGVATFYTHLETLLFPEIRAPAKDTPKHLLPRVKAGQPLGIIGADPLDPQRIRHLHFELWTGGPENAIDPAPVMKSWEVFGPDDVAPFLSPVTRNAAKKASSKHPDFVQVRAHTRPWPGTALRWER